VSAPKTAKRKRGVILSLANTLNTLAHQFLDFRDWHGQRIAALEDRLAKLDRGDDAVAARRTALFALRLHRLADGRPAPESITLPTKKEESA
jgi:hypothetical protein